MSADTAPAAMPGDLVDRCRELLEWGKTGLLQGEAIRAYAEEHFSHFEREADRIAQAERATNRQAMEAVLGFAPILAEKEQLKVEKQGAIDRGLMVFEAKDEWRDRALAAEAALAAERERCVNAAFRALDQMRDEGENDIRWAQERVGSAIRAQGE